MNEPLTFMMGKFPVTLPADRRYCRNHMWCVQGQPSQPPPLSPLGLGEKGENAPTGCVEGETILRFGFTAYAVRLMQDVYFLDWEVNAGDVIALKQKVGHIETSKAMSDLFAPLDGTLLRFNQELLNDPSGINVDMYGTGWLFEMSSESGADTLSVQDYYNFLEAGWERTQNMLKGHM